MLPITLTIGNRDQGTNVAVCEYGPQGSQTKLVLLSGRTILLPLPCKVFDGLVSDFCINSDELKLEMTAEKILEIREQLDLPQSIAEEPELEIGQIMPDGTVYGGISPTTSTRMYLTSAGLSEDKLWKDTVSHIFELNAHGHTGSVQKTEEDLQVLTADDGGFRLPTKDELRQIFDNKSKGDIESTFGKGAWHWTCTSEGANGVRSVNLREDGRVDLDGPDMTMSALCVRTEPRL